MKRILFALGVLVLQSCGTEPQQTRQDGKTYFDLAGFFEGEAARLAKADKPISKTVVINGEHEVRQLKIADWKRELESFIQADINKSAWKGQFQVQRSAAGTTFTTANEKILVKQVLVQQQGSEVTRIEILTTNKNMLYESSDTLTYYPDSLYRISRNQQILLLSPKKYQITGKF